MQPQKKPSQSDFERVTTEILKPLEEMYGVELTEYMRDAFIEDLSCYDVDTLRKAMKKVRSAKQSSKPAALLAALCDACDKSAPRYEHEVNVKRHNEEWKQFPELADRVMRTDFGQMALAEGWGNTLYVKTLYEGISEWHQADAERFRAGLQTAVNAAMEVEKAKGTHLSAEDRKTFGITIDHSLAIKLSSLWEAMQNREKALADKYLASKNPPPIIAPIPDAIANQEIPW